jgi:radical SAM superfamily enzyme YgiQ (UPF0313 family)
MGRVRAFMPPQGLLVIASYLPKSWQVRFIDENLETASQADFVWADIVFVSGMHIQAQQIHHINARAKLAGKVTVLGGPSVSGAPDQYPDFDYLHIGELGDATDRLVTLLDDKIAPPPAQVRLETAVRLPLNEFPIPAYGLIPLDRYFIGSLQFSSGCPHECEFCDIPALYGRQPRLKSPAQVIAELDTMLAQARPGAVYFVDDNFIANRKATRGLLPHLIAWQKRNGYPLQFACEATLDLANRPELLALMREAHFVTVFVGIETPEIHALRPLGKLHNTAVPLLEAIATFNNFGLEVVSGIILGLDTDSDQTTDRLIEFVDTSKIPLLTINLLQALPRTLLWQRLSREGRLIDDPRRESNVRFVRPYDQVVASWRRSISHVYEPERLFNRLIHQVEATYAHRVKKPIRGRLTLSNVRRGLSLAFNLALRVGLLADYRWHFWRAVGHALKRGQIEAAFSMGLVAHHLIRFTREAIRGEQNASFYASRLRTPDSADRQGGPAAEVPRVLVRRSST